MRRDKENPFVKSEIEELFDLLWIICVLFY